MVEPLKQKRIVTVGYTLDPRHEEAFKNRGIFTNSQEKSIDFVKIDSKTQPMDHPRYDCIIHNLYGDEWKGQVMDYKSNNPNVIIVDAPEGIERINRWISVVQLVCKTQLAQNNKEILGFPNQTVVVDAEILGNPGSWEMTKFLLIAKPMVLDGTESQSQQMSVVYGHAGLSQLTPPIVVQELSDDGVIFTVHVAREHAKFMHAYKYDRQVRKTDKGIHHSPPKTLVAEIAKVLREALDLSLFSFDMIRDSKVETRYLVVGIDYFPSYQHNRAPFDDIFAKFIMDLTRGCMLRSSSGESD